MRPRSLELTHPDATRAKLFALARDTVGEVLAIAIQGGDVKAAADQAQSRLEEQQRKEQS